jgi:protein TonB
MISMFSGQQYESDSNASLGGSAPSPSVAATVATNYLGSFSGRIVVDDSPKSSWLVANCGISLLIHAIAVAGLCIFPLLATQGLRPYISTRNLILFPLAPPSNLHPARPRSPVPVSSPIFLSAKLVAPVLKSDRFSKVLWESPPLDPIRTASRGVPDGVGSVLGGVLLDKPLPIVLAVPSADRRLVDLGGDIHATRVLRGFQLDYPELAKAARIVGKVIVAALIDETGKVIRVRAISGPPILAAAAMEAVSRERFVPAVLDGEPMSSNLRVEVSFQLPDRRLY